MNMIAMKYKQLPTVAKLEKSTEWKLQNQIGFRFKDSHKHMFRLYLCSAVGLYLLHPFSKAYGWQKEMPDNFEVSAYLKDEVNTNIMLPGP